MTNHYHEIFQYQDFMLNESVDNLAGHLLKHLLAHEFNQLNEAERSGDTRPDWQWFSRYLNEARDRRENSNFSEAMLNFYWLGYYAHKTSVTVSFEELEKLLNDSLTLQKNQAPLQIKRRALNMLRFWAKKTAQNYWKRDEWKALPVKEMGEKVFHDFMEKEKEVLATVRAHLPKFAMPKCPQFIKWVREVKPSNLPQGRRPKK